MHSTKRNCIGLIIGLAAVASWYAAISVRADGTDDREDQPPADPQQVLLTWDLQRLDLPRNKDGPALRVRADGAVAVTEPHGSGRPVTAQLSAAGLQQLLRFVVQEQGVFEVKQERVPAAGPSAAVEAVLHVSADGRICELRYAELAGDAGRSAEAGRLSAIQQRIERLITWAYAGGDEGTAAALVTANAQLRREIPDAPALLAGDLCSAIQRIDGSSQVVFERRGVAEDGNPFSFVYARVEGDAAASQEPRVVVRGDLARTDAGGPQIKQKRKGPFDITPTPVTEDKSVNWDYPIVYVRAPRDPANLPQFANTHPPTVMPVGSALAILYPDGRDEVLVAAEDNEAITDPFVSFDGEWVFFVKLHDAREKRSEPPAGSDIYKVHVRSKKVVQLTHQGFTPNEGAVVAAATLVKATAKPPKEPPQFLDGRGVYNLGPCPVPGGRIAFTSDRNAFRAAPAGTNHPFAHQLFVMDDDGKNVENIGHLNLGGVLHPVILTDGRLIFTTNETQGLRGGYFFWGVWSIHPDGTNWNPVISAYDGDVFHFYSQLSDGTLVLSNYYPGGLTRGFGTYHRMPPQAPPGEPGFGPANADDPRNRTGPTMSSMPFKPYGLDSLTLFATKDDVRPNAALGKVTHPSGAPDNHLLTVWATSAPPVDPNQPLDQYGNSRPKEPFDSGIYLIKSGRPVNEPGQMVLIRNDPQYHELWPRALVPYERIHGVREPRRLESPRNDGGLSPHLPEGVPYGLVGSSSLYKRESYPDGVVPPGQVTATFPASKSGSSSNDAFRNLGGIYSTGRNWLKQGADAGIYDNSDIHAIRIVITEPVTSTGAKGLFRRHATNFQDLRPESAPSERLRILGEFPVRKFGPDGVQPSDPDGNPDTSFAVKIPADVAWTFQTLDKRGMVLNMSQTWHQVRPGEVRNNCGGCHAHSQKPTDFNLTAAAAPGHVPWDLTGRKLPLLTTKANDQTGKRWDTKDQTGVRFAEGITNVEYNRDVRPILQRRCAACHTAKADDPPGKLVLDDNDNLIRGLPAPYYRLAMDAKGEFGHKPMEKRWAEYAQATRYVRKLQSRRSLLIWKVFGERLDGWTNDDHPTETEPGNPDTLQFQGQPIENTSRNIHRADIDFTGTAMPPPKAVAEGKVASLSDEDRMMLARWVDLGCPLDLDFDPKNPGARGRGWMLDDNRPTVALTIPRAGRNDGPLTRLLVGLHDYNTGIDTASLTVIADFPINGVNAGENLAPRFKEKGDGVWELAFDRLIGELPAGIITVSVKDRQGNVTRIEREFSVTGPGR